MQKKCHTVAKETQKMLQRGWFHLCSGGCQPCYWQKHVVRLKGLIVWSRVGTPSPAWQLCLSWKVTAQVIKHSVNKKAASAGKFLSVQIEHSAWLLCLFNWLHVVFPYKDDSLLIQRVDWRVFPFRKEWGGQEKGIHFIIYLRLIVY